MATYDVCRVDQLVEGRGWPARAGDRYVAVFLDRGQVHVVENVCRHAASPLDGGAVIGKGKVPGATESAPMVRCPWHGWVYDLRTGDHLTVFGARPGIAVYPCRIEAGVVKVEVDDPPPAELRPEDGMRD